MVSTTSIVKSCGFDVEKRTRIFGCALAQISSNLEKLTEVAFCIALAFSKPFLRPPPYHK